VVDLSRNRADPATVDLYYDDVAYELARSGQTMEVAVLPVRAQGELYDYPDDSVELTAVVYDDTHLHKATTREMDAHGTGWRDERGVPSDYVTQTEASRTFRLYPMPEVASKPFIFFTGDVLGSDYPEYSVAAIYQQKRTDLPDYFDLYMAVAILAREFMRESDHRDLKYAGQCEQLAALLLRMVT
jgi:hypothetical protein